MNFATQDPINLDRYPHLNCEKMHFAVSEHYWVMVDFGRYFMVFLLKIGGFIRPRGSGARAAKA